MIFVPGMSLAGYRTKVRSNLLLGYGTDSRWKKEGEGEREREVTAWVGVGEVMCLLAKQ